MTAVFMYVSLNIKSYLFFKAGDSSSMDNYRPISLTSVISKILERIIRDEHLIHLVENNLVSKAQHGFVPAKTYSRSWTSLLRVS